MLDKLKEIPDFYVELKWDLSSSFIPGMHKFLPSDIYKIWKYGTNIRLDFSFIGMRGLRQKRREITFLFRDGKSSTSFKETDLVLLNRHKETVVNLMEDFDFEERLSMIHEIMHSE